MMVVDRGPYLRIVIGGAEYYLQGGQVVNERGEPQPITAEVVAALKVIDQAQLAALGFADSAAGLKMIIRHDTYYLRRGKVYDAAGVEYRTIPAAVLGEIQRMDPVKRLAAGF
jgi:hypothetical protein